MWSCKWTNCLYLLILLLLTLVGCTSPETTLILPTSTINPALTSALQPSLTPTISRSATPTPTIMATPTEVMSEAYVTRCVSMLDELPDNEDLEGRFIIQEQQWGDDIYYYIYNFKTDIRVTLDALFDTLVVSPDHSMVAYLDESFRRLIISDNDGNVVNSFYTDPVNPDLDQSLFPVQWLDNQNILMFASGKGEYPNFFAPYAAIFNIEAGQSEKISMDFPGIDLNYNQQGSSWHWFWWSGDFRLAVSPDQEYLVYPAREGDFSYLIIWDKGSGEEVSRFPGIMPWHTVPRWAPDRERFAVIAIEEGEIIWWENEEVSGDEIFLLDRFGNYEKITKFEAESPGNISFLSWSPDGKKIAFWIDFFDATVRNHFGGTLFVVNIETDTVVNYCIAGEHEIEWSLDGNFLFIRKTLEGYESYGVYSIILVNLEDLWAATIMDFAEVMGVLGE